MSVESSARRYDRYISSILPSGGMPYDLNKGNVIADIIQYTLNRTTQMFRWDNLPDTVPERMIELYLQTNGNLCATKVSGDIYFFTGGFGGEPDPYYRPTVYTVANPALHFSKNLRIGEECAVMLSDSLGVGLMPIFRRYATMLAEGELSFNIGIINSRINSLISAPDQNTRESAELYLQQVKDGKLGIISENAFLDGIRVQPYGNTGTNCLTDIIEAIQYLKASMFNELGLNANYNMKRESLTDNESEMNNDALLPLIDDMLIERKRGADRINALYGTNITVDLSSMWKQKKEQIEEGEMDNREVPATDKEEENGQTK